MKLTQKELIAIKYVMLNEGLGQYYHTLLTGTGVAEMTEEETIELGRKLDTITGNFYYKNHATLEEDFKKYYGRS